MNMKELLAAIPEANRQLVKEHVADIKIAQHTPRTMFVILILNDGFEVYGASSCADLDNFSEDLGVEYAFRHASARLYNHVNKYVDNQ